MNLLPFQGIECCDSDKNCQTPKLYHMVGHPRCVFINYEYIGLISCRTQLICGRYVFIS